MVGYLISRFWWWLKTPEMACHFRRCPCPIVGFSRWCRQHTDRILADEKIDDWPRKTRR